jgi:ketosteroid isomerase-like protein
VAPATNEAEIRELLEARAAAARAKNLAGVIEHVAPEVLAYDVIGPLRFSGSDQLRQRAEQWFSSSRSTLGYEIRDLGISAGQDVAFSHSLNRVVGTLPTAPGSTCGGVRRRPFATPTGGGGSPTSNSVPSDPQTAKPRSIFSPDRLPARSRCILVPPEATVRRTTAERGGAA